MRIKKLIRLSAVFALVIELSAFGQGYFQFSTAKSQVYDGFSTGTAHVGTTVNVAFLWAPAGTTPMVASVPGLGTNYVAAATTTATSAYTTSAAWNAILHDPNFTLAVNSGTGNSLVIVRSTTSGAIAYNSGNAFPGPLSTTPATAYTLFVIGWDAAYATPNAAAEAGASVGWSRAFAYTATSLNATPNNMVGLTPAFGVAGITSNFLFISTEPASQVGYVGATVNFSVLAAGVPPLNYQWQNSTGSLASATNTTFSITNAQLSDAGFYSVVVGNPYNSVTSSIVVLQMLPIGAPSIQVNNQLAVGTVTVSNSAPVSISGGFTNGFIFYTLDGSTPTINSTLYGGPFTLTNSTVVQAMSLSADFTQTSYAPPVTVQMIPVYNLQTSVIGSGTISANPASGPYVSNSVVTLTATPNPNWVFDHWTGNAAGSQNPVSIAMNGPRSVQAVFVQTAYPLTASTPGGGSVTADGQVIAPATYYPTGSVVTLAATASNGWTFLGWQGDASGTNNPLGVTLNQTNNIQAIFGTVVETNAVGGGSIVLNLPNPIPFGTTLTASAVPNAGNYFLVWSGAASGTNTPTTIAVTSANPTISALFTTLPGGKYSLGVIVMGNGSVAISPQQNYYNAGDSVTLNASTTYPGTGFYGWTGDVSGTNGSINVVLNTSKIVQANFGALPTVNISPQNLMVFAGSNAVFSANAAGLPPLSYQWSFNGTNISGATNTLLTLTNVQLSQAGNYAVLVTNNLGSTLSSNALLVVNPVFHFVWSPIPSPRFANTPFAVMVQAQNATNGTATSFTSTVVLVSTNGIPIVPPVSGHFVQGVWTGTVTVGQTATNLVLQASDNLGESGLANPIDVVNLPSLATASSGGLLLVFWPVNPPGFGLETTSVLSPANWMPVTTTPFQVGDQYLLIVQMNVTNAFYRLHYPGP